MREMREELLQFIWQHRLLGTGEKISTKGKKIRIIKPGELNRNSGPDFFNAQLEIDGIVLNGNVEIHVHTSDWLKHGHGRDRNYDNIILHAVYRHDVDLEQNLQFNVEVLEMQPLIPGEVVNNYSELDSDPNPLPCSGRLAQVDEHVVSIWLQRMLVERLEQKYQYTDELFRCSRLDLQQTFYTLLLKSFGFNVNALPFELLARTLPFKMVYNHHEDLSQLEALLLGSAGFLDEELQHKHLKNLQNEFEYLRRKYSLVPLKKELFKFSRLRPSNFPTLRLAQFANLIHTCPRLFSYPLTFKNPGDIITILEKIKDEGYWKDHYSMKETRGKDSGKLGRHGIENLVINAFVNFHFFYAKKFGRADVLSVPLELLSACRPEVNAKTTLYAGKTGAVKSAADSQALIHLYDHYCSAKKCLHCAIGCSLLAGRRAETAIRY